MELKDTSSTSTSTISPSLSIKTLLEPNDIWLLPQNHLKVSRTNLIPAICFYNGTFVPIHAGHLSVLAETKRYIDSLGTHELLGAYISPSHSGYVAKKLRSEEIIGAGHRLAMIQLAIECLDWVMIDLFEIFQTCNTSLSMIMEAFIKRIRSQLPDGAQIDIFWLKGEDALFHTKSSDKVIQLGFHTVYVLNRGCDQSILDENKEFKSVQDYHENRWQLIRTSSAFPERFHMVQASHMNLSSSNIRACARNPLATREQLQSAVQIESITTYILQHHLWRTGIDMPSAMVPVLSAFPNGIIDVTPELLSVMLSTHLNSSIKVISFVFEQIGVGKGWCGLLYRLYNIQYSAPTTIITYHLPQSLVIKLSTGIWMGRVASIEPDFYWKLGPCISNVTIPQCYYAARHPCSPYESLLLLEDLSVDYEPLGPKSSLSDSTLLFLVASIASLHAEFFKHPLLRAETFAWLPSLNSSFVHYQTEYEQKMADKDFTSFLEENLSSKAFAYAKALLLYLPHLFLTLSEEQFTLSHGDFWINNMFIRRGQSHRLVLFDWQTCCRANGLIDVVFILRLFGSTRARTIESQALQLYQEILLKYGVYQYGLSEIREDYYSLALPFLFVVLSSWKVIKKDRYPEIVMILEDIVTYGKKTDRITY